MGCVSCENHSSPLQLKRQTDKLQCHILKHSNEKTVLRSSITRRNKYEGNQSLEVPM